MRSDSDPDPHSPLASQRCRNYLDSEVYLPKLRYYQNCLWAVRVLENEANANFTDAAEELAPQRKYFFMCPNKHWFTTRASGSDAVCRTCRTSHREKYSVATCSYDEIWPRPVEVGPRDLLIDEDNACSGFMVRIDGN